MDSPLELWGPHWILSSISCLGHGALPQQGGWLICPAQQQAERRPNSWTIVITSPENNWRHILERNSREATLASLPLVFPLEKLSENLIHPGEQSWLMVGMTALDRTVGQGTERQGCSSPGEPQSNKAALPKTKGPAFPQGIKSFYYLMIPSVVPEILLWSHYAPCWDMWETRVDWGDGYLQYREGEVCVGTVRRPFPQELWELCALFQLAPSYLEWVLCLSSLGKDV